MAQFSLRRIIKEDFPSKYYDLLDKLLYPLNQAIDTLNSGLNKSLTISDNFSAQDVNITVTAPVNAANPVSFRSVLTSPCRGITCVNATLVKSNGSIPTSQPFFTFTNNGSQIVVTNITGLVDGNQYILRIFAYT